MLFEEKFLVALVLTITIETIVLFVLTKFVFKEPKSKSRIIFAGFFASFATLPYLWFVLPPFINSAYYIQMGETIVIAMESIILWQILQVKIQKAIIASIICNAVSFLFGLLLLNF
ncbi:MAG: hypothetical protein PHD95_07160 [Candidatus ainarchaeum sp.]|nr:hypothetical protein [Candidatus ainarchaeum sp.]